jgi:hypothetical protein
MSKFWNWKKTIKINHRLINTAKNGETIQNIKYILPPKLTRKPSEVSPSDFKFYFIFRQSMVELSPEVAFLAAHAASLIFF